MSFEIQSKHKISIIIAVVLLAMSSAPSVSALDFGSEATKKAAGDAGYNPGTTETTFAETVGTIVYLLLSFSGVIFLVLMVYAGYLWMIARGDEAEVEKAQKIIISSIIGLIILVGAYSITTFVVPRLTDVTGKDEGEKAICCQICDEGEKDGDCEYEPTSIEMCEAKCAGVNWCKTKTADLFVGSGAVCSVANFKL